MKAEHLEEANAIQHCIENHEDFISHCDFFIRNIQPREIPAFDRWLLHAVEEGVVTSDNLKALITDLRDIAVTQLDNLDKRLEAL